MYQGTKILVGIRWSPNIVLPTDIVGNDLFSWYLLHGDGKLNVNYMTNS